VNDDKHEKVQDPWVVDQQGGMHQPLQVSWSLLETH
jgi:hypothetical protein